MATKFRISRRAVGGAAGAPATLLSAELAYNMASGVFYAGRGDDGSGNATSVVAFAGEGFIGNVPAGGASGEALVKNSNADGDWGWAAVSSGGTSYTASGNGIELIGSQFSLNFSEVATGISLGSYALTTDLTTGLAGKANVVHTHDAADIVSGTIDPARLPVLPSSVQIVSSGAISDLTAPQQTDIGDGSIVTTTDGRRWVYTGAGSKTSEASYIQLADITPDWAAISNKPSFATVATTGAYGDLAGLPSLGTIASQEASNVAITGGTIDGVVLDGGTF